MIVATCPYCTCEMNDHGRYYPFCSDYCMSEHEDEMDYRNDNDLTIIADYDVCVNEEPTDIDYSEEDEIDWDAMDCMNGLISEQMEDM